MGHAFLTRNPLLTPEFFAARNTVDESVVELNQGVPFSLLDCPGKFTVQVATFKGHVIIKQDEIREIQEGRKDFSSKLAQAAEKADKLTRALRYLGYEAYQFHDHSASIVTVGSFTFVGTPRSDGPPEINPDIHKIMKIFAAQSPTVLPGQPVPVTPLKTLVNIPFDVQPIPVLVPKRPIHVRAEEQYRIGPSGPASLKGQGLGVMPRRVASNTEAVNSDSFLDIVASVVSIMIIMVVMEGVRIENAPVQVAIPANPATDALKKDLLAEQSLRGDVLRTAAEIENVQQETAARTAECNTLAAMVATVEHAIEDHRRQLDSGEQVDFDLARNLSESEQQLRQLAQQREQAEHASGKPVVVESYPTPLSRAVDGPEAHLLISNGRVVFIPLEPLLTQLQESARRESHTLIDQSEVSDTIGPVDGFRLKYTLARLDVAPSVENRGRGGSYVRLQRWSLIPTTNDLGEPVRLALTEGSDFYAVLSKLLPGRTTITIWVYPDGFAAFRQVRKELYHRGYTIAARPLPQGELISGSPDGSKSAAQ